MCVVRGVDSAVRARETTRRGVVARGGAVSERDNERERVTGAVSERDNDRTTERP